VFHAQRWATAFLTVSGADANEAFLCLKALSVEIKTVHGVFFGHNASTKLEKVLRDCVADIPKITPAQAASAAEYAIRFLCLLVEKKSFGHIALVLREIEQALNEQRGILDVTVESASPVDSGFEEKMTQMIKEKTGASGVNLKTRLRPELLGGYLLRIGSHYIDATLKGQLEDMANHLKESTGGRNG